MKRYASLCLGFALGASLFVGFNTADAQELPLQAELASTGKILFVRTAFDEELLRSRWYLYAMDADGRNPRRLTEDGSLIQSHGWFPDGERILFSSDREGDLHLYEMRVDGTGLRKLAVGFNGSVSPDGQWIAFLTRNGEIPDLNVMRTDGSGAKTIWPDAGGTPSWTPDSRRLAFVAISRDPQRDGIAVLDRDGNDFRILLHPGWDPHEPSWSPDGSKIVLSGLDQIFILDADGQNLRRLTKEFPGISSEPSWTGDNRIVYLEAGDWRVMQADGSDARTFLKYQMEDGAKFMRVRVFGTIPLPGPGETPRAVSPKGKMVTAWGTLKTR